MGLLRFPNESPEYRAARDKLLQQEIELRRAVEAVAKARRELPPGGEVTTDYVFEGSTGKVKLIDLFGNHNTLAIYSYMFGPDRTEPCPMCTPLINGLAAGEEHLNQRLAFYVVAESPIARLLTFAKERGWGRLKMISTAGNSYNRDYHGKGQTSGNDTTMMNVFKKEGGKVRHFWGSELGEAPTDEGQDTRLCDMLNPIFNMFDLTPEGRGSFYTKLRYET